MLVLGFWLSLGPGDGGPSLHGLLVSVVPGYAQLRSPFRFAVFVELMVALLAAGGLAFFHARARLPLVWVLPQPSVGGRSLTRSGARV